jgi:hypothetical protein
LFPTQDEPEGGKAGGRWMISMREAEKLSLQEMPRNEVRGESSQREEVYGWVSGCYASRSPPADLASAGLLRRYPLQDDRVESGAAQLTRLVGGHVATVGSE